MATLSGLNGNVVFSGATSLTGTSTPTLSVNAGTLNVMSTITALAGGTLSVNSGTTLTGGSAAAISVLVTVNSNAVLVPDASQASASLIGGNLTINAGGILQWAYNGAAAEGTIALGGNTVTLPAGNGSQGNPVFRPQFTPAAGHLRHHLEQPAGQPARLDL